MLSIVPITIGDARKWIERHHSHHHAPLGGLCAVAVADDGRVCCVGMLSRPVSRLLQASGACAEINRVASDGTTPHAASKVIATLTRAALALGYMRLVSYTLLGEAGTSYRAAGWWVAGITETSEGWHSREGRTVVQNGRKIRWEFGPGCESCEIEARQIYRENVGNVNLPERAETLPLLARMTQEATAAE